MKKTRKLVAFVLVLLMVLTVPMLSTMAAELIAVRVVVQPRLYFDNAYSFGGENLSRIKLDGKYGFANTAGEVVLSPSYDNADVFSEGLAAVKKNGKWGYIDKSDVLKIPYSYEYAQPFMNGYTVVEKRVGNPRDPYYRVGMINTAGVEIVPCEYDEIYPYFIEDFESCEDGMVTLVKWNEVTGVFSIGFFDLETKEIIVPCSANVGAYSQGLYSFRSGGKWGFKNKAGELVIPCAYDEVEAFSGNGYAVVMNNEKYGLIDKTGALVLPCDYTYVDPDSIAEGHVVVSVAPYDPYEDYYYQPLNVVNLATKALAFPKTYDTISSYSSGLAVAIDEETAAYINYAGEELFKLPFDEMTMENYLFPFYEGREVTPILKDGKVGMIDRSFNFVVPAEYDLNYEFLSFMYYDDYSVISKSDQFGLINLKTGALTIPCQYAYLERVEKNSNVLIAHNKNYKGGLINLNNETLSPFKYDVIEESFAYGIGDGLYDDEYYDDQYNYGYYDEGLLRTYNMLDSEYEEEYGYQTGLLGYDGRELLPCQYAYISPFRTPNSTHAWIFDGYSYAFGIVERGPASADADLKTLTVNNGTLSPKFSAGTQNYTVKVDNSVSRLTVKATANHPGAKISGTGNINLKEGLNTINVVVTAETGAKKTYTIKVTRDTATLVSKISISAPVKDMIVGQSQKLGLTISPSNATNKKVTWKTSNSLVGAVIDSNNTFITKGPGKVTLTATAADGSKKSASVTITVHTYVTLKIGSVNAIQNGKNAKMDTAPFTISGSTMVPLRFVSEKMGGTVQYVNDKTPIKLLYGDKTVEFTLNSKTMKVITGKTSQTVTMPVAPQKQGGRTFIPLRAVSQALGFDVQYEAGTKYIVINNPKMSATVLAARLAEAKKVLK